MRLTLPTSILIVTASCGSENSARSQSPVTVALTPVASALPSETTGDCNGQCRDGTRCNCSAHRCERVRQEPHTLDERCDTALKQWFEVRDKPSFSLADPAVNRLERTLAACDKLRIDPTPATERCGSLEIDVALLEGDMVGEGIRT